MAVPAGTFEALRLTLDGNTCRFARGVGRVKYAPKKGSSLELIRFEK